MENVGTIAKNFIAAADNLSKVAATGDQVEVSNAFGKLGETCKACHDEYRMKD
jgi:cytochrome c556